MDDQEPTIAKIDALEQMCDEVRFACRQLRRSMGGNNYYGDTWRDHPHWKNLRRQWRALDALALGVCRKKRKRTNAHN